MTNLTELLKTATTIKNEQGNLAGISYVKNLIEENDLRNTEAVRCGKKIASFIKKEKSISSETAADYFFKIINERITNNENRFELYYSLSEMFLDRKDYDWSFKMLNGAIASCNPNEYMYMHQMSGCYNQMALISMYKGGGLTNAREYLIRITSACLFEIAFIINGSLMDNLREYFEYRDSDFKDNVYLNDDGGQYDSALKELGLLESKEEIVKKIKQFVTIEITKQMKIPSEISSGSKKSVKTDGFNEFSNASLILDFTNNLFSKALAN